MRTVDQTSNYFLSICLPAGYVGTASHASPSNKGGGLHRARSTHSGLVMFSVWTLDLAQSFSFPCSAVLNAWRTCPLSISKTGSGEGRHLYQKEGFGSLCSCSFSKHRAFDPIKDYALNIACLNNRAH